jgi:EAL domain-containing protein (putative c-di-GMP-specific phosphodiesterase class I)
MLDVEGQADAIRQLAQATHRAGAKLVARGAASPAGARRLLELGVDFLVGCAPAPAA